MNVVSPLRVVAVQLFAGRLVLALSLFLSSLCLGHAQVLSVDLGGPVQSGFQSYTLPGDGVGPFSTTFTVDTMYAPTGSVSATFAGGSDPNTMANNMLTINNRLRATPPAPTNSGSFTQADLLSARLVSGPSATPDSGFFIQLTGFAPNTTFSLQAWGIDWTGASGSKGGNFSLYDWTSGSKSLLGSFTATLGSLPTNNNTYSVTGLVTSDGTGRIVFQSQSNIDNSGIFNGFVLTAVPVPEPSVLALLGLCGIPLVIMLRNSARRQGGTC